MAENHMSRLVSQRNLAPRLLRCAAVACAALCLGFTASADGGTPAYEFLEYASTPGGTGSPRINTEVVPATTMEFRFKYAMDENTRYRGVFGSYAAEDTQSTRIICDNGSSNRVLAYFMSMASGGGTTMTLAKGVGEVIEGYLNLTSAKLNAVTATLSRKVGKACTVPMHVFAGGPTSDGAKSRFWYFSILDGGVYTHHYLPCRRTADGVVGLWDVVAKKLVEPMNGTLTAGPVNPAYRLDANNVCQFGIVATTKGKGTVAVNGGEAGATASAWGNALSDDKTSFQSLTATVTATAAESWRFVRWEGDVNGLTAAEKASSQLTVTTDRAMSLSAVFVFDIPASAYVQRGLVVQFDGIENVGVGQHDSSATTWADLSGNNRNGTCQGVTSWTVDGLTIESANAANKSLLSFNGIHASAFTVETCLQVHKCYSGGTLGCIFAGSGSSDNVGPSLRCGGLTADRPYVFGFGVDKAFGPATATYDSTVIHTTSVRQDGVVASGACWFNDGALLAEDTISEVSEGSNPIYLGNRTTTGYNRGLDATYHSVRLYNCVLTDDEVAYNANIDKIRFEGGDPADLTWPDCYRWNATVGKFEYRVSVTGIDGVEVSLDGETFAEKVFTDWFSEGDATNVTITARPVQDRVIRWEGAPTEAVASGNRISFSTHEAATVTALAAEPRTFHWLGRSANANVASNWDLGDIPRQGDSIVLDSGSNPMTWNLPSGALYGSWTQTAGYTGVVTFDTGLSEVHFTGDVTLEGGSWTHTANPSFTSADEAWRNGRGTKHLIVRTDGNMTVAANVSVHANGKGFAVNQGPANCGQFANHGSRGADWYNDTDMTKKPSGYGSVTAPDTIGSGGGWTGGGGAIRLLVGGTLKVDGTIESRAGNSSAYTGASGSVDISCGKLTGTGKIDADAPDTSNVHGGAGRVAVKLAKPESVFSDFSGRITAAGGNPGPVSPGTVYLETAAQAGGHGELLVIGDGIAQRLYNSTDIAGPYAYDFSRIVVSNYAVLAICSNANVTCRELCAYGASQSCVAIDGGELHLPSGTTFTDFALKVWHPGSVLTVGDTNNPETVVFEAGSVATIDAALTVPSLHIKNGATVNCSSNASKPLSTSNKTCILGITTSGDLTVDEGATVSTVGMGWRVNVGPGAGGAHGGRGSQSTTASCYGDLREPYEAGSGNNQGSGGSVIRVCAGGTLTLNGSLDASGGSGGGSGGSVWVTAGRLVGGGSILARGGIPHNVTNLGGGGRIAITLTGEDSVLSDFDGTVSAAGGVDKYDTVSGGAGTVYLRERNAALDDGTLVIDNDGGKSLRLTDITTNCTGLVVGSVVVTNAAHLNLAAGAVLSVRRNWTCAPDSSVEGVVDTPEQKGGAVAFVDASVASAISGTNTFANFLCTTPGKVLSFDPAGTQCRIPTGGSFTVAGSDEGLVQLKSSADGYAWTLKVEPSGMSSVSFARVSDSDASSGEAVEANDSMDGLGNTNWSFPQSIEPGETITWTGGESTSWANLNNWDLARKPVETDNVVIPGEPANQPELGAEVLLNKLTVEAGASLSLGGYNLTVTNALAVAGTLDCSGQPLVTLEGNADFTGGTVVRANSTFVFAGGSDQSVVLKDTTFWNLYVVKSAGTISLSGTATADVLEMRPADEGAFAAVFAGASEIVAGDVFLDGRVADNPRLTLSGADRQAWRLRATRRTGVTSVRAADCDSRGGSTFWAYEGSVDGQNNQNWRFDGVRATWTGAGGNALYTNALNWSSQRVPDGNATLEFADGASPSVELDGPVAAGRVSATSGTVRFYGAGSLHVVETFDVGDAGTVTLDVPTVVSNSLSVRSGGTITHTANSDAKVYELNLTVLGDATVSPGGAIQATAKGYAKGQKGPGGADAAAHGGRGIYAGYSEQPYMSPTYGSILRPVTMGSSGTYGAGGGVVRLVVGGLLTVHGDIAAGGEDIAGRTGAGGSVWITANALAGKSSGHIHATGGRATDGNAIGQGGGGRVAVYLTGETADFDDFAGTITAFGGGKVGGCGSVYLETASDGEGGGRVIYDAGSTADKPSMTTFPAELDGEKYTRLADARLELKSVRVVDLAHEMIVRDVAALNAQTKLNLNDNVLRIRTTTHRVRGSATQISGLGGLSAGANGQGRIVWGEGLLIFVR